MSTKAFDDQPQLFGHPIGLYVLFFTEMWERFSYYGMRALLVLFLTTALIGGDNPGWGWERSDATLMYGWYIGLVYLTPIIGGWIADKFIGFRKSVTLGALIMTLGHASMALELFADFFFYVGLGLMILGNGLFKPNISSMVGQLYKNQGKEKDAGYTIFYMGINSGAFLGILLCGYIGETVGWHYGFGLAGVFMLVGMLQFKYAQNIFGNIGLNPKKAENLDDDLNNKEKHVVNILEDAKTAKINRDRIIVISIFALFTVFFWWAFEQAGGSMTIFASDYTDRSLEGTAANTFKIINAVITIVPMIVITWVLSMLFKQTFSKYALSNIILGFGFAIIWLIVLWMLVREFNTDTTEVKASWFGVLNSLFIIIFAPVFSKIWESKYNPSGPVKFAIGLISVGLGFGILSYGAASIPDGAQTASVSLIFLVLAYLFHTLGELCVSPVGLSYVSKLAPLKLVGMMFGIWFIANFLAGVVGGWTASYIDPISEEYGLSAFFLIFTLIPAGAGIIMLLLSGIIKKMMHGIK